MAGSALITGVGRLRGIGAAIAEGLAADGWTLALSYWTPYDRRIGLEGRDDDPHVLAGRLRSRGATVELLPTDLEDPASASDLVAGCRERVGPLHRWSCRIARVWTSGCSTPSRRVWTGITRSTSAPRS